MSIEDIIASLRRSREATQVAGVVGGFDVRAQDDKVSRWVHAAVRSAARGPGGQTAAHERRALAAAHGARRAMHMAGERNPVGSGGVVSNFGAWVPLVGSDPAGAVWGLGATMPVTPED